MTQVTDAALKSPTKLLMDDLLRLQMLAQGVELGSRRMALSVQAGGYRSVYRGRGMEFDEVRAYQETDDSRMIDWRVTARRGQPYTKLFREERERPVLLLVDLHPGMYFGSQQQFKSVLAGRLAALLGWAANRAGDRVGGLVNAAQGHHEIHPAGRDRGLLALLHVMVDLQPQSFAASEMGRMDEALARLNRLAKPGSLVVIFSDFRELSADGEKYFSALSQHNDVISAFIADPLEVQPPPAQLYHLGDGQRRWQIDTHDQQQLQHWQQDFIEHQERIKRLSRRFGVHFMQALTNERLLPSLTRGLRR